MSDISVDILIFTYNQESIVKDTIKSAINQSYDNIQKIIIADDGSTDNTPLIINEFSSKYPVIIPVLAKENKGIAYNMNRAIKHSDSDYVSFLDGDDIMYINKIEKQVNYFRENPDIIACAHDMDIFKSNKGTSIGKFSEDINFKKMGSIIDVKSIFDPSMLLCPSSIMYKQQVIPKDGMDIRLKYGYEFLFIIEVLMNGDMGYIDKSLGSYRLHETNVTSSEEFKKFSLENFLMVYSIIISRYPELHSQVKKRRILLYLAKILESINDGEKDKAKILSKTLMSEGSFFKGAISYIMSFILNKERINTLYENKKVINFFLGRI